MVTETLNKPSTNPTFHELVLPAYSNSSFVNQPGSIFAAVEFLNDDQNHADIPRGRLLTVADALYKPLDTSDDLVLGTLERLLECGYRLHFEAPISIRAPRIKFLGQFKPELQKYAEKNLGAQLEDMHSFATTNLILVDQWRQDHDRQQAWRAMFGKRFGQSFVYLDQSNKIRRNVVTACVLGPISSIATYLDRYSTLGWQEITARRLYAIYKDLSREFEPENHTTNIARIAACSKADKAVKEVFEILNHTPAAIDKAA